jgi:hypothetical protein
VLLTQKLFRVVTLDEYGLILRLPFARGDQQTLGIASGVPEGDLSVNQILSIDIGLDGVTPNDPGDTDEGQNGLQNFPVLVSAATQNGQTKVTGTLNSLANQTFLITLYSDSQRLPSGHGLGEQILDGINVTTDPQGNASFTFDSPELVPAGKFITATATRLDAALDPIETSEFSQAIIVNPTRGDYNANGTVDAADYVVWRNTRGQAVAPLAGADGSGNGVVDQADHDLWRANFGKTWSPAGASAAMLEPTAEDEQPQSITTTASSTPSTAGTHPNRAESTAAARRAFAPSPRSDLVRVASRPAMTMGNAMLPAATPYDDALLAWLSGNSPVADAVNRERLDSPAAAAQMFGDEVTASIDSTLDGLDGAFESIGQEVAL